jgi:hypothetical protein
VFHGCSRCAYEKIKKQVRGIARIYVRAHPSEACKGCTSPINGSWAIYVVPKGMTLKDVMDRHNWRTIVKGHPMRAHRKEFHV